MKKTVLILLLTVIYFSGKAQVDSINNSLFKKTFFSNQLFNIISNETVLKVNSHSEIFSFPYSTSDKKIKHLDIDINELTETFITEEACKIGNKKIELDKLFTMNNHYFMIGHTDNCDNPAIVNCSFQFYILPFDIHSWSCNGEPKLIYETTEGAFRNDDFPFRFFDFSISLDSLNIVFVFNHDRKKSDLQSFHAVMLDNEINLKFSKDLELKYTNEEFIYNGVMLTNSGQIIMKGYVEIPNSEYKMENAGLFKPIFPSDIISNRLKEHRNIWLSHVIVFSSIGDEVWDYQFANSSIKDEGVCIKLLKNNHILYSGYFSDMTSYIEDGIFINELDPVNKSVVKNIKKQFEPELIKKAIGDSDYNEGNRISYYKILDIINRENGKYYMISEKRYLYYYNSPNGSGYAAVYKNIMVASISSELNIDWISDFKKSQNDNLMLGGGLVKFYSNEKLYFMWNASMPFDKNSNQDEIVKSAGIYSPGNFVACSTVLPDGKVEYRKLNKIPGTLLLHPDESVLLDKSHLLITADCVLRNPYSRFKGIQIINLK